jgi:hypothetical protein
MRHVRRITFGVLALLVLLVILSLLAGCESSFQIGMDSKVFRAKDQDPRSGRYAPGYTEDGAGGTRIGMVWGHNGFEKGGGQ